MACKRLFKVVWKCFKWLFLLTLPWTGFPVIIGIVNGVLFPFWQSKVIDTHANLFLLELMDLKNDWGPADYTFRDFRDTNNDFHVLRLNSNDWASKLGFLLPQEYGYDVDTPINNYGDLSTLMVNLSPSCDAVRTPPPKEQWVYISDYAWPLLSKWDSAFDKVVQAGYVPSALNKTRFFYAECRDTAGFLCGVWGVRAPTLLHFLIEDSPYNTDDMPPGLTYPSADPSYLHPVTVRVIELPLEDAYTGLPSTVFPSHTEQMLAFMLGDRLYEQFEPWVHFDQVLNRFTEYINNNIWERKGTLLYHFGEAGGWVYDRLTKPLGLEDADQMVMAISFLASQLVVSTLIVGPWCWMKELWKELIGEPTPGERYLGAGFVKEWNYWDELMGASSMMHQWAENVRETVELEKAQEGYTDGKITTSSKTPPMPRAESLARAEPKMGMPLTWGP